MKRSTDRILTTYVTERLEGFGGEADPPGPPPDMLEFPDYLARTSGDGGRPAMPACEGPIAYRDTDAVRADIAALRAAVDSVDVEDAFLSAASPGVVAFFLRRASQAAGGSPRAARRRGARA